MTRTETAFEKSFGKTKSALAEDSTKANSAKKPRVKEA
jgi:hypothetical protein